MTHIPYTSALPKDPDLQPSDIPFRTCRKPAERPLRQSRPEGSGETVTFQSMRALLQRLRLPQNLAATAPPAKAATDPSRPQVPQFMATHPRPSQHNQLRAEKRY